jgi:membrane fusion protein, multidrug efflux system
MSHPIIKNSTLKNYTLLLVACSIIFISCGAKEEESVTTLKTKQAELKTQLAEVTAKIAKLEGDSTGKFALVEAKAITPAIFKSYISVQGHVDAEENVTVSSEMPGTITKINVKVGDNVSKGQVLAETDARAIQETIAEIQTNLNTATLVYEKSKNLWDQKIGTEVQFLGYKNTKEGLESRLATYKEQLRMSKIISPIDGVVDAVDIKLGQATAPGAPAVRVINFSNLKLKADLAESFASKVHKGDEVMIKFPDSNDTLTSTIYYSSRAISALNRTFGVEILLNGKGEYHPNQIANISINDYKSATPVISIPLSYVQKDLKGGRYVLVAEGKKAVKRSVVLGKEYNGSAEIKEGLTDKDLLITEGYDGLNDGDAIKLAN